MRRGWGGRHHKRDRTAPRAIGALPGPTRKERAVTYRNQRASFVIRNAPPQTTRLPQPPHLRQIQHAHLQSRRGIQHAVPIENCLGFDKLFHFELAWSAYHGIEVLKQSPMQSRKQRWVDAASPRTSTIRRPTKSTSFALKLAPTPTLPSRRLRRQGYI